MEERLKVRAILGEQLGLAEEDCSG